MQGARARREPAHVLGREVKVYLLATGRDFAATIARHAPAADIATRTVHFELEVDDADRSLLVGTTAELSITEGRARS